MSFDRFWSLKISDRLTSLPIESFSISNSKRMQFSVNSVLGIFLNFGTVKIYNIPESKRNKIHYRSRTDGIGKGPKIKLEAGYSGNSGNIIDGSIHDAYSTVEGPDVVTIIRAGIDIGDIVRTLPSIPSVNLTTPATIASNVQNSLILAFTYNGILRVPLSKMFSANMQSSLLKSGVVALKEQLVFKGSISSIINYLNSKLKIIIFINTKGELDVREKPVNETAFFDPFYPLVRYSTANNGLAHLAIGNPIDYIEGVKFRSFMNPSLNLFQQVYFSSRFISRSGSIKSITHMGDTRSEEWYSDVDMINKELIKK